jgi:hypothetical protein
VYINKRPAGFGRAFLFIHRFDFLTELKKDQAHFRNKKDPHAGKRVLRFVCYQA